MTTRALAGARIFDGDQYLDDHAVVIEKTRIAAIVPRAGLPPSAEMVNLKGGILSAGFIDVQVNGGGGALLNHNPSIETVKQIAASHRKFGTTGLLPTVITDAPDVINAAIAAVEHAINESVPGVLGIHIEGPFLDVARKGAHDSRFIRPMTDQDIAQLKAAKCPVMLTVAPNRVTPEQIRTLTKAGIRVSLGHSDATSAEAAAAIAAGATAFTHIFNAMSQLTGREPGMVGAALASDAYAGLIADGHHAHPDAIRTALKAKGRDRIMLISDAMPTAAGGPASFELQGRKVNRDKGKLTLEDGTLAGSNLTMDEAVRYCIHTLGLELGDTLRMATRTPAEFLGRKDLGRIARGALASLVHLGDDLQVKQTWINGT